MGSIDPNDDVTKDQSTMLRLVEAYVEARIKAMEERALRLLGIAIEKVKDEAWETRAWILLLTAASWGALAQDQDPKRIIGASVTLGLVALAGGFLAVRRILRRRRQQSEQTKNDK